ncbi:hypothetical protein ElyMa_001313100 [Elysia marginata]|uniref:PDZ domain-containing protein n=1 Tax=Elysia marginata TaxID=1093978 RepID=A0AAV4IJ93_9GAST|nr:hypothetical protein ElyMa_001313100 [Elysia marginata]
MEEQEQTFVSYITLSNDQSAGIYTVVGLEPTLGEEVVATSVGLAAVAAGIKLEAGAVILELAPPQHKSCSAASLDLSLLVLVTSFEENWSGPVEWNRSQLLLDLGP